MLYNADFTKRASVHGTSIAWIPSPIPGVERHMLDRVGDEVARATTLVRYAPQSAFSPHTHGGGEEFIVLRGVFQDEHGDYPVGTYVRNPPTSRHTPRSDDGCIILVKLRQFDPNDRTQLTLDTTHTDLIRHADEDGVASATLFHDTREHVRIEEWAPSTSIERLLPKGGEFFVLSGEFSNCDERFTLWSWLRLPSGATLRAHTGSQGVRLWTKTDHLAHV